MALHVSSHICILERLGGECVINLPLLTQAAWELCRSIAVRTETLIARSLASFSDAFCVLTAVECKRRFQVHSRSKVFALAPAHLKVKQASADSLCTKQKLFNKKKRR